jgi:hypothetical protein
MSTDEDDGARKTVMTYVPAYQKDRWKEHADRLGMSQSEFVRTMVQAGRRDFEVPDRAYGESDRSADDGETDDASDDSFERRVLDALSVSDYRGWDQLLEALTDDIEDRLDETLQSLQAENRVQYSGRHGGYALSPDGEADDGR